MMIKRFVKINYWILIKTDGHRIYLDESVRSKIHP